MIPAAGIGKRFYPLTRSQPKEMLPILDKPVIHYVVEEAINSGLDEILIIVGAGKDAIINYFDRHHLDEKYDNYGISDFPDIYFVRQKEQNGLADSIKYSKGFTGDEDFVILLGDTIYESRDNITVTSQIIETYYSLSKPVIAVEEVPREKTKDYGIIDGVKVSDGLYSIKNVQEKPDPAKAFSNLGITGIYVMGEYLYEYLDKIGPGANSEFQLADAFLEMIKDMEMYAKIINGMRYDIGTMDLWIKTFIEFAARDKRFSNYILKK